MRSRGRARTATCGHDGGGAAVSAAEARARRVERVRGTGRRPPGAEGAPGAGARQRADEAMWSSDRTRPRRARAQTMAG